MMRTGLCAFMLTAIQPQLSDLYAQNVTVTLSMRNATVEQVLDQIEKKTDYTFVASDRTVDLNRKVSLNVQSLSLEETLQKLFAGTNVSYKIVNNQLTTRTDYESPGYTLLIEKLSALSERFYAIDSTHFDEHVEKTLLGLGFQRSDFNRPTSQLSGGWRMRIELAKLLLKSPDVLLAEVGAEVYGFGVSDDGTVVGFYGGAYGPRVGFLWKAGESDIQRLATAFPGATRLADYDEGFFNTPCAISADGRYIAGFAHISPEDLNEDEYYVSWVLDTQDPDAAGSASDVAPIVVKDKDKVAKIKALYSLDGARRNTLSKGINILRMSDGKSLKELVK